jgi:hypothetical protein
VPITVASIKVHTPPVTKGLYTLFLMRSLGEREWYAGFGAEKLHLFNIPRPEQNKPARIMLLETNKQLPQYGIPRYFSKC